MVEMSKGLFVRLDENETACWRGEGGSASGIAESWLEDFRQEIHQKMEYLLALLNIEEVEPQDYRDIILEASESLADLAARFEEPIER